MVNTQRRTWLSGLGLIAAGVKTALGATAAQQVLQTPGGSTNPGAAVSVADFGAKGDGQTDDTRSLQLALDHGGAIWFPPGTFITDGLKIRSRSSLTFAGIGQTTLVLRPGATSHLLSLETGTVERIQIRGGVTLDGNKGRQSQPWAGIWLAAVGSSTEFRAKSALGSNDPRHFFEDIVVVNCKGDGWHSEGRGESFVDRLSVYQCDGHGIYCNSFDMHFGSISSGGSGLHGILLDASAYNNRIATAKSFYSGSVDRRNFGDGFHCRGHFNQFGPIEIQDARRHGLYLSGAGENIFSAVHVESPGVDRTGLEGVCGIRFYASSNNIVTAVVNDRDTVPSMAYGIYFESGGVPSRNNIITAIVRSAVKADIFGPPGFLGSNSVTINGRGETSAPGR